MKKKLLLADDSVTIQKVVQITFSHDDYDLTVVDNGEMAYEKARSQRPDLVLADVFMPGKNGYELCAAIKNDPALASVPVLLLTGTFEPFDEAKARSVGADRWIAKPFESQALIACVEELLLLAAQAPAIAAPTAPAVPLPVAPPAFIPPAASGVAEEVEFVRSGLGVDNADDIWSGDFVTEGAAASVYLPGSDPFAPTTQDDLWDVSGFEAEETVVSAAGTDDLWGSFEGAPSFGEDSAPIAVAAEADVWGEDDFSADFSATASDITDLPKGALSEIPLSEDVEIVEEIDLLKPMADIYAVEDFSFTENVALDEEVPDATPLPLHVEDVVPPAQEFITSAAGAAVTLPEISDVQLDLLAERVANLVVSRLSETLLEKIAWEVVPDLAETMIREELRKIRETVAAG